MLNFQPFQKVVKIVIVTMENKDTYLDHSATTYMGKEVVEAMEPYFGEKFGNPSSMHNKGLEAKNALDDAREKCSKLLNCEKEEIIFTGSGTESINLAIQGLARASNKKHIITTGIEHHAVLDTVEFLETQGYEVTKVPVNKNGLVDLDALEKSIKDNTLLITIIYVHNEIGVIQDIKKISEIAKKHNVLFHTDACQAGYLNLNVKELGVDYMTLNGSKIYGPKGTGMLYKKKDAPLKPLMFGGGQEFGLRSGTQNIPGIVGFVKALELIQNDKKEVERLTKLRDKLTNELLKIPKTILIGDKEKRVPHNVNISFLDIEGESILLHLNEHKIYISTGSACTSSSLEPSHVIVALGYPYEVAHGSIRFTLGRRTTEDDIDKVLKVLPDIVQNLRDISPLNLEVVE